jgi:hypothetical protein
MIEIAVFYAGMMAAIVAGGLWFAIAIDAEHRNYDAGK